MIKKDMEKSYELVIYIPTYNREDKLANCLKIIADEIKGFEEKVRVFVSNNGSTDGTAKLLGNLKEKWLIKKSHPVNQEAFLNIIAAYDLPIKTKFIWTIGDDDYLLPDAIKDLLQQIQENPDVDFIFCNTTAFPATDAIQIMEHYLSTRQIGSGSVKSNVFQFVEKVDFERLIDPRIADTLLAELMVLCFRQEKFYYSYEKATELNRRLQTRWRDEGCSLIDQGMFRQPHNLGLLASIKSSTPSLYHPKPKTFNFWGSATDWLTDYDYVFPVIMLFLINEYKNKNIIDEGKYLALLDYYFKVMQVSFIRQKSGETPARRFSPEIKSEFFDALFNLAQAKKTFE